MANKKTPPINPRVPNYVNDTGTDLGLLQSLEQSWKQTNGTKKRNTAASATWFRNIVTKNWRDVRTARMFRDQKLWRNPSTATIGKCYFYEYQAESVDFYDRYPLAFIIDIYSKNGKGYVTALNMHWLPPALRQAAFKAILTLRTEKRYRSNTKLKMEWALLKAMSESNLFKHAIKCYRADRFKSVMVEIPSMSWELVLFLPTQRFVGGSKEQAWAI